MVSGFSLFSLFSLFRVFFFYFSFFHFFTYKFITIIFKYRSTSFHLYKLNMEINCLKQLYEMCFLLYLIIGIYIIRVYLDKKFKKKEYKYWYYTLSPSYQNLTYIFIKKNGKHIFKVYWNIIIGLRYLEIKNPNS